jgi:hypothetical protein
MLDQSFLHEGMDAVLEVQLPCKLLISQIIVAGRDNDRREYAPSVFRFSVTDNLPVLEGQCDPSDAESPHDIRK